MQELGEWNLFPTSRQCSYGQVAGCCGKTRSNIQDVFILARPLTQPPHMGSLLIHRMMRYQLDTGSSVKKWLGH